jgi:hypothetical protein
MGLGNAELGGEGFGGGVGVEPVIAEAVEAVGVVREFGRRGRREGEEGVEEGDSRLATRDW